MSRPVFRFAPSPNGYLHLGHALSAIINSEMARATRGRLLLRIEDIDRTRCRPEFEAAIHDDLAWLGVAFEPEVRRQSEHLDDYRAALATLERLGLVYPTFESRAEIARMVTERESGGPWPVGPDGAPLFPGSATMLAPAERRRRLDAGEPFALRLDMTAAQGRCGALRWTETGGDTTHGGETATGDETATGGQTVTGGETAAIVARPQDWGDVVLARKDTPTSYHLAVVVDDALQGVTHVVRGRDLFCSTSVHRVLQALLGLPAPIWHHHRLLLGPDGRKLAKSTRSTALRELRAQGLKPADIRRMVGL
jgi:glutamyl-Q tRNA(Asp) synthetase